MFKSDLIDFFSRVPWYVVPAIYVPAISFWMWTGSVSGASAGALVGHFALGVFIWSLLEYWLHRTLFHWIPSFSWGEQFHFILHGVHHTWHQDRYRLVMPPAASVALGVVVWAIVAGIGAALSVVVASIWTWGVFAGIMFGYLCYDMIHYYTHHGKPTSKMMLALRSHHMKHHHNKKFKDLKFGVSNTLWDHVFDTYE